MKSFVYLDDYKMYSLSSQLFEGLTEYIIRSEEQQKRDEEIQKGPFNTGKTLADIIQTKSSFSERRFLHDYAYILFERELAARNLILDITSDNIASIADNFPSQSFFRVRGNMIFNDAVMIQDTLRNFNDLGYALGVTTSGQLMEDDTADASKSVTNPDVRAKLSRYKGEKEKAFRAELFKQGMQLNSRAVEALLYVLQYGFQNALQVVFPVPVGDDIQIISADLKREKLIESESSFIRKFSRRTERTFTMLGMFTQVKKTDEPLEIFKKFTEFTPSDAKMKHAVMNIISHLSNLDSHFIGKQQFEYMVDPISIYIEL